MNQLEAATEAARVSLGKRARVLALPHGSLVMSPGHSILIVAAGYDTTKSGIRSCELVTWLGGQSDSQSRAMMKLDHRMEVHVVAEDGVHRFDGRVFSSKSKSGELGIRPNPLFDWETLDRLRKIPEDALEDPSEWLALAAEGRTREAIWYLWRQWIAPLAHDPVGPLLPAFLQLAETSKPCRQNHLLGAEEAEKAGLPIRFYYENQYVCHWAADDWNDGRVVLCDGDGRSKPRRSDREQGPLAEFLLQLLVFERSMGGGAGVSAFIDEDLLEEILSPFTRVPGQAWCWPAEETQFHAAPGMLAHVTPDAGGAWLFASAKTPLPLRYFRGRDVEWDRLDA